MITCDRNSGECTSSAVSPADLRGPPEVFMISVIEAASDFNLKACLNFSDAECTQ
jgi:hypothetical protein